MEVFYYPGALLKYITYMCQCKLKYHIASISLVCCVYRCNSTESRTAAYELLTELANGSHNNLREVCRQLIQMHHQPNPDSANEWEVNLYTKVRSNDMIFRAIFCYRLPSCGCHNYDILHFILFYFFIFLASAFRRLVSWWCAFLLGDRHISGSAPPTSDLLRVGGRHRASH